MKHQNKETMTDFEKQLAKKYGTIDNPKIIKKEKQSEPQIKTKEEIEYWNKVFNPEMERHTAETLRALFWARLTDYFTPDEKQTAKFKLMLEHTLLLFDYDAKSPMNEKKGCLLYGNCGSGKTIAMTVLSSLYFGEMKVIGYNPKPIRLVSSDKLVAMEQPYLETYLKNIKILIIDDIGREQRVEFESKDERKMARIIYYLADHFKGKIYATSNVRIEDLMDKYGDRATSRLFGMLNQIDVNTHDYRKK